MQNLQNTNAQNTATARKASVPENALVQEPVSSVSLHVSALRTLRNVHQLNSNLKTVIDYFCFRHHYRDIRHIIIFILFSYISSFTNTGISKSAVHNCLLPLPQWKRRREVMFSGLLVRWSQFVTPAHQRQWHHQAIHVAWPHLEHIKFRSRSESRDGG